MRSRGSALALILISISCFAVACRPTPAPPRLEPVPTGPKAPLPQKILPALLAVGGRGAAATDSAANLPPISAIGYGPRSRTQGGGTIFVRFNQPVVSLEKTNQDRDDLGIVLTPPAAGRSYFQTPELLVFEPAAPLPPSQQFTARLFGQVTALTGAALAEPVQWNFTTPRPRVSGWEVLDREDEEAPRTAPVIVTLEQPTTAAELQPLVTASAHAIASAAARRSTPVAVRVTLATPQELKRANIYTDDSERGRIFVIHPLGLWPAQSEIVLTVRKGLRSQLGPLVSEAAFTTRFRTLAPLRLVHADCAPQQPCGLQPIALRFNNRIGPEQLAKLRIWPKPDDFEVSLLDSWSEGGRELSLTGVFMPGTTYKVQLPAELTDKFGQRLAQAVTVTAVVARRPTLALNNHSGTLRHDAPQVVGVMSRHVQALRVRGAVLDDPSAVALLSDRQATSEEPDAQPAWPTATVSQFERTYTLRPHGPSDWDEVSLDLAALSGHARRAVLLEVQATQLVPAAQGEPVPPPVRGLFRMTDLGPVAVASQPRSVVAVMRLSSGRPVAGARLSLHQAGQPPTSLGSTDESGILVAANLPALAVAKPGAPAPILVAEATADDDHAYMHWPTPDSRSPQTSTASELRPGERALSHLVTERDAYLPGEQVRAVGWLAVDTPYERSGLRRPRPATPVVLELHDSRDRIVATQTTTMTAEGKFWAELAIPEHGALGSYTVRAQAAALAARAQARVRVEDFRVPEFSVAASVSRADLLPGESTTVATTATYFFGGPMRIRRGAYSQRCVATGYRPPGLPAEWTVGAPIKNDYRLESWVPQNLPAGGLGVLRFSVAPPPQGAEHTRRCEVNVNLTDSSFQSVGAQTQYLAHAARYYVAAKSSPGSIYDGDRVSIPVRAVTVEGARLAASGVRVSVVWHHSEPVYKLVGGKQVYERSEERQDPVRTCTLDLAAVGSDLLCEFQAAHPGRYEVTVRGGDRADTRHAHTQLWVWVQPRPKPAPIVAVPSSRPPERLELSLSSTQASPGDMLRATIRAPWRQACGVLILARNGIRDHRAFQLRDGTFELDLPVDDSFFPRVSLEVVLVHVEPHLLPRIEHAAAQVSLMQAHRRLQVTVTTPPEAGPRAELPIAVRVNDSAGKPCAARLALWAVDEAVLSLTDYSVPDPLPVFVPTAEALFSTRDEYGSLIYPFSPSGQDPWFVRRGFGSGRGSLGGRSSYSASVHTGTASSMQTRNRFETTPLFLGDIATGPSGLAQTTVHLPDNLTTFRITAVASARLVDGESPGRFGLGDARVRVSAPLIVRAALPRLLRPGDAAELGALVNNLSGPPGRMRLTVRLVEKGPPSLQLLSPALVEQTLAAGDQLRIPFALTAVRPGQAMVEVAAVLTPLRAGAVVLQDAVQLPLAVEAEPTLRERVATYGELTSDDAVALPVQLPAAARADAGGITVSASTSLLGGVAAAAASLIEYPYGCVEQTASRLLPLVALRDVMQTYPLPIPDGDVQRFLSAGVQRLLSMQTAAGGFSYWPGGREPNVYATAYVTWVLHLASRAGYPIPQAELGRAADYLQRLVEPPAPAPRAEPETAAEAEPDEAPSELLGSDYLDSARRALVVQVLAELGRPVPRALAKLIEHREELPLFARALLVEARQKQVLPLAPNLPSAEQLSEELLGNIAELPGTAHINEKLPYSLAALFHSATRTDAMVLLALLRTHPSHPVVAKLARGLLEQRGSSGFRNTQETAYAVLALAEYARIYEKKTPNLTARAWVPRLGAQPQWEAQFSGRSFGTQTIKLPMVQLLPALMPSAGRPSGDPGDAPPGLILQLTGQGRLYYRVGLEWTPSATELPARAQGLRIERRLRTAQGPVTAASELPPAEPVAIDLTIENRALINYVVVDVPLPAGLEAVQLHLGRGQRAATLPGDRSGLVSHQEVRRDRALLFFDLLPPGTHTHTIYVRATTPGRYSLPPAQAEAMYTPEIYGRSSSLRVAVSANLPPAP